MRTYLRVICALIVLAACSSAALAQRSMVTGTVTDQNGQPIPGVNVTLIKTDQGLKRETTTNEVGSFTIPLLAPGPYALTAERLGFATVAINDIVVQVGIDFTTRVLMRPAVITETVAVQAESNQIITTDATIKHSITNEQVRGLPVLTSTAGRTPLSVLPFLLPGVVPTSVFASLGRGNRQGEGMSINGNRTISISYNFEGGDHNDYERNLAGSPFPNPDALATFTVITNNYQADVGRSSGGVVNAVTKSGTNDFHGNLRYYFLNEALNARSFFDGAKIPPNRLNTWGGQIGGPVVVPKLYNGRDRTHFFFDYEGTRFRDVDTFPMVIFSDRERAGDFSNLPPELQPLDPLTGEPFPGGKIPANRINPISRLYLDRFVPRATQDESIYNQALGTENDTKQYTARVDQKIGGADTLSGTFFYNSTRGLFDQPQLPVGSQSFGNNLSKNFVLSETHVFSPRTVNQFTGTITRQVNNSGPILGAGDRLHPRELGFTGVIPQTDRFLAAPSVFIEAIEAPIGTFEIASITAKTTWQIKDDLSHAMRNQTLKFGGEVRSFIFNSVRGHDNGRFSFSSFNDFGTANSIADFLLGIPTTYTQSTGNTMYPRQRAYSFYAMDDWKVRPNLTVNLGLRYELTLPMKDELDQISAFRFGQKSQRLPRAPLGLLFVGDPDPVLGTVPRGGYPTDKNNLAPRLGIAYSPMPSEGWLNTLFGEGKTSIRAGWGVFYDQSWGGNVTQFQSVQPYSVTQVLSAGQIGNAGGTFANPFGSLANPFPLDLSARNFTGTPLIDVFDPDYRTAYTYHYNFSIQRELPWSLLLDLAYVGSNTFKADRERQINLGIVRPGATVSNLQSRRTYPQFSNIRQTESTGRANYNSAQIRLTRRFKQGLAFDSSYVFSKSLDNGSSPQGVGGSFTTGAAPSRAYPDQWSRSAFDRRHNFVTSYTYDLPTTGHSGALGRLLNGWQIGGITQFRSGAPFEIVQNSDSTLTGRTTQGNPDILGNYTRFDPRQVRTLVVNGVPRTGNFLFDPNAFRVVTVRDFTQARPGTLGRNVIYGPGVNHWAASLIKRTRIVESHEIELRADINNLFNHANFVGSPQFVDFFDFGQISSAAPGRTIQLSLRYSF